MYFSVICFNVSTTTPLISFIWGQSVTTKCNNRPLQQYLSHRCFFNVSVDPPSFLVFPFPFLFFLQDFSPQCHEIRSEEDGCDRDHECDGNGASTDGRWPVVTLFETSSQSHKSLARLLGVLGRNILILS